MALASTSYRLCRLSATICLLLTAFTASQNAQAGRIEVTFGGMVSAVVGIPTSEPLPVFGSVFVGDSFTMSVTFDELTPDLCNVSSCPHYAQPRDALGIYAFESMTLTVGSDSYSWTSGVRGLVLNDDFIHVLGSPDLWEDNFALQSDRFYYDRSTMWSDRVHAQLNLPQYFYQSPGGWLDSDAIPFRPDDPPSPLFWADSRIYVNASTEAGATVPWEIQGAVTSYSMRSVPEAATLSYVLLLMGAGLLARATH